jgi:hypothetical protein
MVLSKQGGNMKQPYHARLQIVIAEWIKNEGGSFGQSLVDRRVGMESYVLTVDEVAKHMATSAMTTFEAIQEVTVTVGMDT